MKVCLINPILFSFQRVRGRSLKNNIGMSFYPPLGLCYIATALEKEGIDVIIIDRNVLMTKNNSSELVNNITEREIKNFMPDIIGITATTPTMFDLKYNILSVISNFDKKMTIVVGGPHPSALPEDTISESGAIDIVCRGEGEMVMLEIARGIKLKHILGITYKEETKIINNPSRKPYDNIDDLCFPARHLVDMNFHSMGNPHIMHGLFFRSTTIFTSRGCPYDCSFCSGKVAIGQGVRFQSPELIIEEIERLIKDYKIEAIYFADDMFDINKDRARSICQNILKKKLHRKFVWNAQLRANSIDKDLLKLMKEAGCIRADVGFESGSQKTLNIINKKTTVAQNYDAAKILHEVGILIHANIIVGLPGEDLEDLNKTKKFLREIKPHWIGFGEFVPLPGSKLYKDLTEKGEVTREEVENLKSFNFTKLDQISFNKIIKDIRRKIVNPTRLKYYLIHNIKKPMAYLYIIEKLIEYIIDILTQVSHP